MNPLLNLQSQSQFVLSHFLRDSESLRQSRIKTSLKIQAKTTVSPEEIRQEIPTINAVDATREDFLTASKNFRHPVVIRGLLKDSAATQHWNLDYFIQNCGNSVYPMMADPSKEDPITKTNQMVNCSVREMLTAIQQDGSTMYLGNLTRIFHDYPRLIQEMELHRLLNLVNKQSENAFDIINFFMGGKGTGTGMHSAFAGNFFSNIVGRKEWILIHPKYTPQLLPLPAKPFLFSDVYFEPKHPELGAFTQKLPHYHVVLEPGDVLYNAPWWWHRVRNLDKLTIGCAVRYLCPMADWANNPLFTLMSEQPKILVFKAMHQLKKLLGQETRSFQTRLLEVLDQDINYGVEN